MTPVVHQPQFTEDLFVSKNIRGHRPTPDAQEQAAGDGQILGQGHRTLVETREACAFELDLVVCEDFLQLTNRGFLARTIEVKDRSEEGACAFKGGSRRSGVESC